MYRTITIIIFVLTATFAIQAQKATGVAAPTTQQLSRLGLKGATLKNVRTGIWRVTTQKGVKAGFVVNSSPYATDVRGFRSTTPVLVYVDQRAVIRKITALPNQETPEFFQEAEGLLGRFLGKSAKKAQTEKVDVVSGATFSSRGLIGHVHAAIEAYRKYAK